MGDDVRNAKGETGEVEQVAIEDAVQEMYNLTVDQAHTFYVGEGQWLVHNAELCNIPAIDLYYSQKGASQTTRDGLTLIQLRDSISQEWNGEPLRVLKIDNFLVSLNHRRLIVSKQLKTGHWRI